MQKMTSAQVRQSYLDFFAARDHAIVPGASLVPVDDPTLLFSNAGMNQFKDVFLGLGSRPYTRAVDTQKCMRVSGKHNDLDVVGRDGYHHTFFEMLGNWSLGDYFKKESLAWSYEFLTQVLALDPARLSVTVFAGDADAPRDDESAEAWRHLGIPNDRIYFLPKKDNWWGPAGATGPCGPDSEIFYDTGKPHHPGCAPGCACGKWFEIWNNVFMEYNKTSDGRYVKLRQQNVDTGMGVDRTVAVLQGYDDVFLVETLYPLIARVEELAGRRYADNPRAFRMIADHVRASTFAIADGATPSNVEAGYIVRRLIRRAVRYARDLGITRDFCAELSGIVVDTFAHAYPELEQNRARVTDELAREETKFQATLARGLREYHKKVERMRGKGETTISAAAAFDLFETFGFPLPLTVELACEQGLRVDETGFESLYQEHKETSRRGSEHKFKGGLVDHATETTCLHTATHLLHQALRQVLGTTARQEGSNIMAERLRFDFSYPDKLTPEQIHAVEEIVNAQIANDLPVTVQVMSLDQAISAGALAFFGEKYGEQVKVYSIGAFSKEVCGGPHVNRTGELGKFKITKQESIGHGVRRLRAVLGKTAS